MRIQRKRVAWVLGGWLAWVAMIAPVGAEEPIAVIVHPSNRLDNMTTAELARIFSGETTAWGNGDVIIVLNRPIEHAARRRFYRLVFQAPPTKKFFQPGTPFPFESVRVESNEALLRFVARTPGVIGYLSLSAVDRTVRVLAVDGFRPDEAEYPLR